MRARPLRPFLRTLAVLAASATLALALTAPASAWWGRDRTPPSTPGNFRVVSITQTSATLAWSPSTDNRAVDRYTVTADGAYGVGEIVDHPGTTTTLTGLSPGPTYTFPDRGVRHVR